ncbi:MAG: hypothetical protein IPH44_31425 [Myxococcales bacterium]|nr:hypothetical protein [Myxococcales bacterium]
MRTLRAALADDAALAAEADGADTPELARRAGALTERRGDPTAAGAAWAAARAVTIDARLAILGSDHRAAGAPAAIAAASPTRARGWCVHRAPSRPAGPAAPRCRAWLAEAAP